MLLSVQLKHNTLQLALLVGKRYGFEKLMLGLFDMELDTIVIICEMTENPMGYGTEGRYKTPVCEYR